ncbi:mercury methylation corrinoid protein HgcA [Desulfobacula phenolica]|uniref:CO dehydrogenase/acetyl-CoA synthase delta subunit n=1 Tax=Desulfobacula phenolica TaxID=90732 RepID=A0A1H2FNW9_9BACT|nr:mercury methylation corrinoid protein HgcA [Desulfobacula phenolica]SDU09030.1 CO dehydrogenase/acetyl-CoA synthase delta subunit [Desulfobacula phenolica]
MKTSGECDCNEQPFQKSLNISSFGVHIMSSMEVVTSACSSEMSNPEKNHEKPGFKLCSYVYKFIQTDAGPIPIIKSRLGKKDLFSTFYVRCGINRHKYTVSPGLYGIGNPDKHSEVLVTANFKLTFDHLRQKLPGINAWILVLNTNGINVWCAAGKGTFSTRELANKIKDASLEKIVDHKRIIVPQLGAIGVSARDVKKLSGFRVVYGPVRANDISAFLKNNKKAEKKMRQVTFTLYERFILTPVEVQMILKPALITALVLFILSGFGPGIFSLSGAVERGAFCVAALLTGIISGAFITPVLLPFIPFRHFALKGIITGSLSALLLLMFTASAFNGTTGLSALFLFIVTVSSYLAMNFTGATPFTSPSGVEKEMKLFIPVQLAILVIASGLWIFSAF